MKTALFIGRFQPLHKAHLSDIMLALKEYDKIIIAVGSSQDSNTKENPFTFEERKGMIDKALLANHISPYEIVAVPDINDDSKWVEHVKKIVPEFDVVYTGNDFTEQLFKEKNIKVVKIDLIPEISATEVRKRLFNGNKWKELVPEQIKDYIKKIYGIDRLKKINNKLK